MPGRLWLLDGVSGRLLEGKLCDAMDDDGVPGRLPGSLGDPVILGWAGLVGFEPPPPLWLR